MADVADRADFGRDNIAAPWWHGGCSVIPIKTDGTKSPSVAWKLYQKTAADSATVKNWFEQLWPHAGVAVVCGQVSGNLEMLELEGRANSDENIARIEAACTELGIFNVWQYLTTQGYVELSPSGGLHIIYRVLGNPVPGNEKIATRPARDDELNEQERQLREQNPHIRIVRVLAETRGEGGYVIVAPTEGWCHPSGIGWVNLIGTPGQLLGISWEHRCLLHKAIRSVLHEPDPQEQFEIQVVDRSAVERDPDAPLTPVEDFNSRASWHDSWFTEQGWRVHHQDGNEVFWTRPGKDWGDGHSASTGVRDGGQDCLYVWSTSTGLPVEVPLTKFMVFAHYKFEGKRSDAARYLRQSGYGKPLHPPLTELHLEELIVKDEDTPQTVEPHSLEVLRYDQTGGIVLTDTGYALRVRDKYRDCIRYSTTAKSWYVWHSGSGTWSEDRYCYVDNAVQQITRDTYNWIRGMQQRNPGTELKRITQQAQNGFNNARIKAAMDRLQASSGVSVSADDFDCNLDLLNLQNGTLNLSTFELTPHTSSDMLTMMFNASYDPEAECPNFIKYLEDVFPDEELRNYVKRVIGYSLLGRPRERALFLLHGPSGTGKSVFTEVLTELFGDYGITAPASTFKLKKQESTLDLHQLRGKRFVSASEMPQRLEMDEELVKRITGGDRILSRGLYEKFIQWEPRCVIWLATNHLPKLSSDDDAMWRRVRTIPMRTIIKHQKEEIGGFSTILIQEANGLLNWALNGLQEYRRIGLAEPSIVIRDIAEYREESDTVSSWLNYTLIEGGFRLEGGKREPLALIYNNYERYCVENGTSKFGYRRFARRLESLEYAIETKLVGGKNWVYGLTQEKGI